MNTDAFERACNTEYRETCEWDLAWSVFCSIVSDYPWRTKATAIHVSSIPHVLAVILV